MILDFLSLGGENEAESWQLAAADVSQGNEAIEEHGVYWLQAKCYAINYYYTLSTLLG